MISDGSAYLNADGDVFAADLTDGHLRWQWKSGNPANIDGSGNETIAVAKGIVVTTKGVEKRYVIGLDQRTGAVRWERPVPQFESGPYDSGEGTLVFTSYNIEVIDDRTGTQLWSGPKPPLPPGSGTPIPVLLNPLFTRVGGLLLVTSLSGGIDAVNGGTGRMQWHYPGPVNDVTEAAGLLLLTPPPGTGASGHNVPTAAVDPATGRTLWSSASVHPGGSSIFTSAGPALMHMEFGPQVGALSRIDPSTGHVIWNVTTQPYAVAAAGGVIADTENTGYQSGLGSIVGRNPMTGASVWRTPIGETNLVNGRLFTLNGAAGPVLVLENRNDFIGYDPRTGARNWEVQLPPDAAPVDGVTATLDGLVVQVSQSQYRIEGH